MKLSLSVPVAGSVLGGTFNYIKPEFETVFIMAAAEHSFLSSSAVREIASYGPDAVALEPQSLRDDVLARLRAQAGQTDEVKA